MNFNLVLNGAFGAPPEVIDLPETPRIGEVFAAHDGGELKMLIVQGVLRHLTDHKAGMKRALDHTDLIVARLPKPGEPQLIVPGR